jgi:hypothetical protein
MNVTIQSLDWQPDLSTGCANYGEQIGWRAEITLAKGETAERPGASWKGSIVGPCDVFYSRSCYRPGVSAMVTAVGDHGPGCDLVWSMAKDDCGVDFAALAERDGPFRFPYNDLAR